MAITGGNKTAASRQTEVVCIHQDLGVSIRMDGRMDDFRMRGGVYSENAIRPVIRIVFHVSLGDGGPVGVRLSETWPPPPSIWALPGSSGMCFNPRIVSS